MTIVRRIMFIAVGALALSGCATAEPTPAPTEAAPACDPAKAEITWAAASTYSAVPAGVQLITYSDGGATRTVEVTRFASGVEVDSRALDLLAAGDDSLRSQWERTLRDDLARTGQVDENFGAAAVIPNDPIAEPTVPVDGQFVVSVEAPLKSIPFTVDCGRQTIGGTVNGADGGLSNTFLYCGDPVSPDATVNDRAALDYCTAD
jgi:hypothetical protein